MTVSAVFALFLFFCFSLWVWEGHNRWLTYWKQKLLSFFLIDLLLLFYQQNKKLQMERMTAHALTVAHKRPS